VDLRPPLVTMTHDLPPRCPTSSTAAGGRSSRSWMAGSTELDDRVRRAGFAAPRRTAVNGASAARPRLGSRGRGL